MALLLLLLLLLPMQSPQTPLAPAIIPSPAQGRRGGAICPLNIPMGERE
jgi:hypothetical protein